MSEWTMKTLDEVVELRRGFDLPQRERRPGPYPVLTAGVSAGSHDEGPIKGPGFVVGRATNLGVPTWSDTDYWPLNTTLYAADFNGNDPKYLFHLFETLDLAGYDSGSVQPMLNRNYIAKIEVAIAPLDHQRAIAEVLGALDDKIAADARAEGLMDQLIATLHTHAIEALGHKVAPLFEVFDVDFGEAFKGDHFTEPGVGRPLIRIRDLKTFSSQIWTTETRARESIIQPGQVVVGMDAEFRPTWWLGEQGLLNQRVCRVRGRRSGAAFSREALRGPLMEVEGYKTATTVIHLNKSDLERVRVTLPSSEALSRFEAAAEPILESRVSLAAERRTLARMRDALLPQLMSGKIQVKDAEQMVGDVV